MNRWLRCLLLAVMACAPFALCGCLFGGGDDPDEPAFWWDDAKQKRLDSYELPPAPGPTEASTPAPDLSGPTSDGTTEPAAPAKPAVRTHKESSAGAIPIAPKATE